MQLNILPIFKRELKTYFQSPSLYVVAGLFFLLVGYFFNQFILAFSQASQNPYQRYTYGFETLNITYDILNSLFGLINFLMLFIIPIFTMRLIAEEKKTGTFELITTCPISDAGLVLGKFFAAFAIIGGMIIICLIYPLIMNKLTVTPGMLEWKVVSSCFLGLFLMSAAYISFGLFASSVTENQIISAIISYTGLLLLFLIGNLSSVNPNTLWAKISESLSIHLHSVQLTRGVIRGIDIIYFIALILSFLFLSTSILESRRWRV